MRGPLLIAGLYAILDLPQRFGLDPAAALEAMLDGGASVIQLRSKAAPLDPSLVAALARRCQARGVPLIINDEVELAERGIAGVAGVHLGQGDLARLGSTPAERRDRRISLRARNVALGISTHDLDQLRVTLQDDAPDYVGFGPVFSTRSKANPDPVVGLDGLAAACVRSTVAVVAIGGIDRARAVEVARAGASAFAVISALAGPDPSTIRASALALREAFGSGS